MVTERLDTAVRNFQHTNQMVERYTRLSRAYVKLAERFNQLDVEHMTLKSQVIPLLQALKTQKVRIEKLLADQEKLQQALEQKTVDHRHELETLSQTYEDRLSSLNHDIQELKPLENLFTSQVYEDLITAEEQMDLVETTLQEMAEDSSPDLNDEEKALLAAYQADPQIFLGASVSNNSDSEHSHWTVMDTPVEDRVRVVGY
ncbi:MAG: hypothetical protein ACOYMP_12005 [Nodosilinea sp.]